MSLLETNHQQAMTRRYEVQIASKSRDRNTGQRWRQPCRSLLSFTVVFAVSSLLCQALREYVVSQITSLEKQFGLSSTRSGFLVVSEDIGYIVAILLIGHFGRHGNIPRILGITIVILGCAGTMSGVSYFFSPDTLPSGDDDINVNLSAPGAVCVSGSPPVSVNCEQDVGVSGGESSSGWVVWFLTAMGCVQGVAQSARFSLGAPYIEDNAVSKAQSTLYNGILLAVNYLGTPVALGLGSVVSNMPLDLKDTRLFPGHPQWIGAWWLGYLILGVLTALTVIPLFFYPRSMRQSADPTPDQGQVHGQTDLTLKQKAIDLPKCLCRLLRNPVFTLLVCGNCLLVLFLAGSMAFDPKYVETQFMVPAYQANYTVGAVGLIVLMVGTLGGTIITSRLKMTNEQCLKFSVISMALGMAFFMMLLQFGCDNPDVVGLQDIGINSSLSAECSCDVTEYFPVCGEDGNSYRSPCFAGCTNKTDVTYSSCVGITGGGGMAGLCSQDCDYLYYYVAVEAVSGTLGTFPVVAIFMTIMRCVDPDDKAMAMAVTSFATTLLGFLPAPIIYGAVIDSTCKIWGQSCEGSGACALYDLPLLRTRVKGLDVGFQLTALVLYIVVYLLYKLKVVKNNDTSNTVPATVMESLQAHV